MMVLVDTSVWIDFFAARPLVHVEALESLIMQREDICICGVILAEVLQGIRNNNEYKKTKELFASLLYMPMPYPVFSRSAEIYRTLRRKGKTIRKPVDCMIASVAIENDINLLQHDKDFLPIEKYCGLKLLVP
jgi:predicted nucleic acid-binding protein